MQKFSVPLHVGQVVRRAVMHCRPFGTIEQEDEYNEGVAASVLCIIIVQF